MQKWHLCNSLLLLSHFSRVRFCDPIDGSPPGSPIPGNTGVDCHFLLQCMKEKSESEVAQSCQILRDPMGCNPSGSSVHWIFQARVLEWGAITFSICNSQASLMLWFRLLLLLLLNLNNLLLLREIVMGKIKYLN